jgi:arginyl-tRNA synthetase
MDIFSHFEHLVVDAAVRVLGEGIDTSAVSVQAPRDPSHGDMATNVAMVLAGQAKTRPRDLAVKLVAELASIEGVETLDIAGPGFINLTLSSSFWRSVIVTILQEQGDYGRNVVTSPQNINLEYVSANPTGPMHVGHCRGAVFGDVLANLLEFAGHNVTREYYINDAGTQVDILAQSVFLRYREALGENIGSIPEGLYPGDYLKPVGEKLARDHGHSLLEMDARERLSLVREIATAEMMNAIRSDLAALGVKFDVFFSEKSMLAGERDMVADTISCLQDEGLIYTGCLPPPKGKLPDDWEEREQTLFRSTDFGDDVDRALVKSDGTYTYFASDMAYHRDKFSRGFKTMIDVWGADHGGYIKRMQAAVAALSNKKARLDVKICQLVKLLRNGEPVKMSKRSGSFVTLAEVVEAVGKDPVRFMMVYRKNNAPLDFDFTKVLEQSKDNPVFYVQYAHARIYSVFRNVADIFPDMQPDNLPLAEDALDLLEDDGEIAIMRQLAQYPVQVKVAADNHEPHRMTFYLYELAASVHGLWNRGKDMPHLRFINPENEKLTSARLLLLSAAACVLASGLEIIGVTPVREMR